MRMRGLMITGCALALSCSASEDANDAVRCAPDLSCPDQYVCYRGFCVESPGEDAGAASSTAQPAGPSAPVAVVVDAGSGSEGTVASAGDASASGVSTKPEPAGPAVSEPTTSMMPATQASPASVASPPVPANAGSASAPSSALAPSAATTALPTLPLGATASSPVEACIQMCAAKQKDEKPCEQCFEALYGDKPHKLCSGPKADPATLVVCAAFCAVDPEGPFSCEDSRVCHGAACGSD